MEMRIGLDVGSETIKVAIVRDDAIDERPIRRIEAKPLIRAREALEDLIEVGVPANTPCVIGLTGAGGAAIARAIGAESFDEPVALAAALALCCPDVRTVIDMGREGQKYLAYERDPNSGRFVMTDCSLGDKCAAGSGAFLDHMAARLNFPSVEEFARVALETDHPATLSGRCTVFTESDIVHLYQKGTSRERIAAGIHQAICRNYHARIAKGKPFDGVVAFIGGVSENPAAVRFLREELKLDGALTVPRHNRTLGAIGAALRASRTVLLSDAIRLLDEQIDRPVTYVGAGPLRLKQSEVLAPPVQADLPMEIDVAALGVDIGSVSTKAALVAEIDGKLQVLASYYRKTDGDPLAAVRDTLDRIQRQVDERGLRIGRVVAATTGSGRYLTGDYIGADLIKNEITAQASGAMAFSQGIDTVFEIGGQDSKYIRLDGDVVVEFEMNKACAAGCGAFLEKQAARLGIPITDFGDLALRGTNPPPIDWTCTVFTESATVFYQQAGVPAEDLCASICTASVRNYLNRVLGGREIGQRIAFQGAVAFNRGMVAAFETGLGRKIVVPPFPHLTGAIGAARLALLEQPEQPAFRGFDRISDGKYAIGCFECKLCPSACDVNTFQMEGGSKFYYNDRCDRFGTVLKKKAGQEFPDLFEEREKMLFAVCDKKPPEGAKRVGVPRGTMFEEYFPLYNAFLTELGFEVVPSDRGSRDIVRQGLASAQGDPCFPLKVAHGYYANLLERNPDYIFAPGVISTEQHDPKLRKAQTCPYVQASPELLATATGVYDRNIPYITPRIHFSRGKRHLVRVFTEVAKQLGKTPKEARRALDAGLDALARFRAWQRRRGQEVLDSLRPDETAFVVIGRPYTLYDETVNTNIGKKIRDLGILPIPQDFLPITETEISDSWPRIVSRQIQRKLAAARIIRQDPRLRAVVLSYYGCGPDSFGNPFFKDELGEPCYVMQIDEHTADAGVITRLEAFADSAAGPAAARVHEDVKTPECFFWQMEGRKLWVPDVCEGSRILAGALRAYGFNAEVLPRSNDPALARARDVISEDVCLPMLMTTDDILTRVAQPGFNPAQEAFFQGNSDGPCRFGMYAVLQRRILDKLGLHMVDVASIGYGTQTGGPGANFTLVAWDAMLTHDLVQRLVYRTRPYEKNLGQCDALYNRYVGWICDLLPDVKRRAQDGLNQFRAYASTAHLEPLIALLEEAVTEFGNVPTRDEARPLVGVVGEFFVRLHEGANQDVVRKIEQHGGEAWLAPATEFFAYSSTLGMQFACQRWHDTGDKSQLADWISGALTNRLGKRDEHVLWHAVAPVLGDYPDIGADEVIANGSRYLNREFGGEAICSLGKAEDYANRGLAGVVSVRPFNCMPGGVVAAMTPEFRRRHGNLPFLNLDYDGFVDSSRDMKLANFMWQVKERWASGQNKAVAANR